MKKRCSRVAAWIGLLLVLATSGVAAQETAPPIVAVVLGEEVRADSAEEMQAIILDRLFGQYAAEKDIVASEAEIDAYLEGFERMVQGDRADRAARIAEIDERLQSADLAADEREALEAERETAVELQAALAPEDDDLGPEEAAEMTAMRREMARASIERWQLNRELHHQYGGRVIFQQFGPEPLDAYRRFLEDRQADGSFTLTEPSFEGGFWHYFRDDSIHSFYDSSSAAGVLETPPWQAAQ
jgi:soluble cytochrome b562